MSDSPLTLTLSPQVGRGDALRKYKKVSGSRGFTLIELAIVLLILSALFAGILIPFTTQIELRRVADTQKTMLEIREALIGFAETNGRLPCPASAASHGQESFVVPSGDKINGNCSNFFDGFVPAALLGIGPSGGAGYVLDAWNNRIRYAVSNNNQLPSGTPPAPPLPPANFDFTGMGSFPSSSGEMRNVGMPALGPDLHVCSTATGITAASCAAGTSLVDTAVAVIYSTGPNAMRPDPGSVRVDENANANPNSGSNDKFFVSHDRAGENHPNGEFDDIVIWLSPNILYARMIAAGRLP
jgi:prepilin-type N-terminal cleavage/methylation domain-containing protein